MSDCPCLVRCVFMNGLMTRKPATAKLTRRRLCCSAYQGCARYLVFEALGQAHVADDLQPDQMERARWSLRPAHDAQPEPDQAVPDRLSPSHSGAYLMMPRLSRYPRRFGAR
jgi:hypothetical protein